MSDRDDDVEDLANALIATRQMTHVMLDALLDAITGVTVDDYDDDGDGAEAVAAPCDAADELVSKLRAAFAA